MSAARPLPLVKFWANELTVYKDLPVLVGGRWSPRRCTRPCETPRVDGRAVCILESEGKGKGKRNAHLTDASHFPDIAEAIAWRRILNAPTLSPATGLRAIVKRVGRDCWGITAGGGTVAAMELAMELLCM